MSSPPSGFATRCIHAGCEPDPATGAIMTPIYQTSTYAQVAPGVHRGYEYARTQNPTRTALERSLAALEGGAEALALASGMAAADLACRLLGPGDIIIAGRDLYGGTRRLLDRVWAPLGIGTRYIDATRPGAVEHALGQAGARARLVWLESPSNPLLETCDLAEAAQAAHAQGARLLVDNTFATPFLQRPLELGADMVLHSTTKYLGGHSDVVGGALITSHPDWLERLRFLQNAAGAVPGPLDCFLVLRGIKTLPLRMEAHQRNARAVAEALRDHPRVERVYYPGWGGMVSFRIRDGREAALSFMRGARVFTLAESLGGVESLICHPLTMTHASVPPTARAELGIDDGLIRLSVGLEDLTDLVADLESALAG